MEDLYRIRIFSNDGTTVLYNWEDIWIPKGIINFQYCDVDESRGTPIKGIYMVDKGPDSLIYYLKYSLAEYEGLSRTPNSTTCDVVDGEILIDLTGDYIQQTYYVVESGGVAQCLM